MFGALRLFLAFLVVFSHLVGGRYLQHFGYYAVQAFFVLSGFFMTAGLNELYGFDARRFWINRLLRLLPLYYVVCMVNVIALYLAPAQAAAYIGQWQPGLLWRDAVTNVLMLPLHHIEPHYRLVPTAWSLAVELEMYVALFLFIARSQKYAMLALTIGLFYHAFCSVNELNFGYRYFGAPSAVLAFSLGALIYFYRKQGQLLNVTPTMAIMALCIWAVDALASGAAYVYGAGYYADTILFAVAVCGFANFQAVPALRALDNMLGALAYPVFLVQWFAGFVTALLFFPPDAWRGWSLAFATIPMTLTFALVLAVLQYKVIEPLRLRVRGAPADGAPANFAVADRERDREQQAMTVPAG